VLCSLLIGGRIRGEASNPIMRTAGVGLPPGARLRLAQRGLTLAVAALIVAGAFVLVPRIGREFMPPLNEGDLMFMPVTDPAISLTRRSRSRDADRAIKTFPEWHGRGQISRAETSTDPRAGEHAETIVNLKPRPQATGMTREKLIASSTRPPVARGLQHLDAADYQPDQHADHGHPLRGRGGVRQRP